MGRIGVMEIIVILGVIIILFGVKKLPEIGQSLGKALREFKEATSGKSDTDKDKKAE